MKYAICNEMFEGWELEKIFSFISSIGYRGLEFAPFTFAESVNNISADVKADIKKYAKKYNVSIVGNHWLLAKPEGLSLSSKNALTRKDTADYLCRLAEFTSEIGGELMVLGSPKQRNIGEGQSYEEVKKLVKEALMPALEICREKNIDLCMEPLAKTATNFIYTAEQAIEFIEEVSHPNFKLHLDVRAMSDEGKSIPDIIRNSKAHLRHFHTNDANEMHPGSGDIDYAPILEALKEIGYHGWLSLEVFDFSPGAETIAKESIEYLKRFI